MPHQNLSYLNVEKLNPNGNIQCGKPCTERGENTGDGVLSRGSEGQKGRQA